MAKNWTTAEAVEVIRKGTDKEAIQDIGRRFPLFVFMAASGVDGLIEILKTMPYQMTARRAEKFLKDGSGSEGSEGSEESEGSDDAEAEEEEEEAEEEVKPKARTKKPAGKKPAAAGRKKKKPEPEPEPEEEEEEEEEEEDEDGYDEMSLAQLKREAKKEKVSIKGLKSKDELIAALRGEEQEEEEEDDDEDWDL